MVVFEEYISYGSELTKIYYAKYIGDYAIRIQFSDGNEKLVDFKPFLSKSLHPSINKYLEEKLFIKYRIIDGNLNWNDYELIFPIEDLYNGRIEV